MNNVQLTRPITTGISPESSAAQWNNDYAQALALGDPRHALKQYDRGGISRGGAQYQQAGIDAAQSLANGIADAYNRQADNAAYNANLTLQAQQQQEQAAQQLGGFQSQQAYSDAMQRLNQAQMGSGFIGNTLGGASDFVNSFIGAGGDIQMPQLSLPNPQTQLQEMAPGGLVGSILGGLLR